MRQLTLLLVAFLCLSTFAAAGDGELKALPPGEYEVKSESTRVDFWSAPSPKLTSELKKQMSSGRQRTAPKQTLANHLRVELITTEFIESGPTKMVRTGKKDSKGRAEFKLIHDPKTVHAVGRVKVLDGPFGGTAGWVVYARTPFAGGSRDAKPVYKLQKIKMRKPR